MSFDDFMSIPNVCVFYVVWRDAETFKDWPMFQIISISMTKEQNFGVFERLKKHEKWCAKFIEELQRWINVTACTFLGSPSFFLFGPTTGSAVFFFLPIKFCFNEILPAKYHWINSFSKVGNTWKPHPSKTKKHD